MLARVRVLLRNARLAISLSSSHAGNPKRPAALRFRDFATFKFKLVDVAILALYFIVSLISCAVLAIHVCALGGKGDRSGTFLWCSLRDSLRHFRLEKLGFSGDFISALVVLIRTTSTLTNMSPSRVVSTTPARFKEIDETRTTNVIYMRSNGIMM